MSAVSGLILMPPPTARGQATEQARVAAEVMSLICSGNQLLNESGLPRIFPKVQWTVLGRQNGRDPSWAVVEDSSDPTYMLMVRRAGRPLKGANGFLQYAHTIRVARATSIPFLRWRSSGHNITRPEHLAALLYVAPVR